MEAPTSSTEEGWTKPLLLSLLAGLSTCLGAAPVFCLQSKSKNNNTSPISHETMAFCLALAGSVMVTVSFVSILPESFQYGAKGGAKGDSPYEMIPIQSSLFLMRCISFGIGCLLYVLLSKCAFPEPEAILEEEADTLLSSNAQEDAENALVPPPLVHRSSSSSVDVSTLIKRQTTREQDNGKADSTDESNQNYNSKSSRPKNWLIHCFAGKDLETNSARRAWRVTMLLFISLAVHNAPEGIAVAACTMNSLQLGLTTTVAIALHNIPEGICIAIPCLAARPDSPCLAFWLASLSGLAEPLGALIALLVLDTTKKDEPNDPSFLSMKNVLAFVAGIMTTVALIELFPEAGRHSKENRKPLLFGLVAGAVIMIGSDMYLDG